MDDDKQPGTDPRVEAARSFCSVASEWRAEQLKRENGDLAFQVPEKQWTDDAAAKFKGGLINGIFSPPRAMLSISKIDQPVQLVLNQERQAHLGVQVHPLSEDADKETAERIQDLYRGIERESFADLARTWAYERAVKAGMGYYRILTDYADDGGSIHDQKIVIKRILDQRCVLLDPFATEPDWSDGQKALIYEMVPFDRYKRQYPDSKLADFEPMDFDGLNDEIDGEGWIAGSDAARTIRIAEYFYIEFAEEVQQEGDKTRTLQTPTVKWCKVNGVEVLEEAVIPGKYIPIIPVIGQELQPFDDERRFYGLISRAKDPQRLLNIEVSNAVNKDALSTKVPWLVAEGQEEGHEQEFELSTVRNLSMIRYKPTTISGQPVPPPQRMLESPDLSSSLQLINQANEYIQATTFTYDPSLGKGGRSGKPARAILAEQQQSEQGNSNYLDNLARAMRHEARVILGMIPTIYDRPGRRVRGVDGEDNEREMIINAPFVSGSDGRPQLVEGPQMPPTPMAAGMPPKPQAMPKPPKTYDLRKGVYGVSVNIGKSSKSRMEAGSDALGSLLQAQPNLMPILGPTWLNFQDFPGAKEAADLLKKMQPPQLQQGEDGEASPEQLQAQKAQLQAQIQQMGQQMQQMQQALQTKQVEQQGKIAAAQASDAGKAQIEQMKADVELQRLQMQGQIDAMLQQMQGAIDLKLQNDAQAHEVAMASAGAHHEAAEREAQNLHTVGMAGAESRQADAASDRQHEQSMEAEARRASMQGDGAGE